jgi:UDP-N-acetylglucosamine 2-epimerase (non-hydrolysing)
MKVVTIIGTRPEWIRLSLIIPKLDVLCDHILIDTGQNYDLNLRDVFLRELGIRNPDYNLNARGSFGEQLGKIMTPLESILLSEKPDAFLVLGDTNSSLGAIMAKRLGIRVFHMEAGNRCFDERVPEETNRRIIDHSSDILLPYTERSRQNLLDEGIPSRNIYVTGNPVAEVLDNFHDHIGGSEILEDLSLDPKRYFLVTIHRSENVDNAERLEKFISALNKIPDKYEMEIIWPVHPKTRQRLNGHKLDPRIRLIEPLGLFDFVRLEKNAYCVLTDSGTVQEECCLFMVPVVTLRDSTERPETIEVGSNFIAGCEPGKILKGIEVVTNNREWEPPREYLAHNVSDKICRIVLGHYV